MEQKNEKGGGAGLALKNILLFVGVALVSLVLVELLKLKILPLFFQ
ncbi:MULTISPECIES: hypothetical protein [Phenylobacterium]|jgi:hypothetical protein|uniref:Uncharacterized protein n=1 Tax=Phenylobacterium conjunctum TaxID=1298959 RepID=A0ABW3T6I7_9CAUL|nr:hypothetical protein [Deltaproteobacteria bacterium]